MRRPRRFLACLSILTLSALAHTGPARCAEPADTASVEIEGLTVFGMHPLTTQGGSSAIRAVLDSLPIPAACNLEQVLRSLPAIHVRTNSRGEAEISVRGSESRQVAGLLDGVPLTLSWDGRTDVSVIPVGSLQQATLVRGLSTLLSGPNVLGGAIEFETGAAGGRPCPASFQVRSGADQVGASGASAAITAPLAHVGRSPRHACRARSSGQPGRPARQRGGRAASLGRSPSQHGLHRDRRVRFGPLRPW
jgi:outer membrane receptor for ferrienterochelin and colicin